jgi:hypothetical protein
MSEREETAHVVAACVFLVMLFVQLSGVAFQASRLIFF